MKKVLTMTLNPCIDRTVYFDTFQAGATNIVKKTIEEAAGKGINVAVGLKHLDIPVKAMGFAYKEDKDKLYGKLDAEQIECSFVEVDGRLRVNQKLFDESKSEMTECNEKGMPVASQDVEQLLFLLKNELAEASLLVLSGSVPPGVDKDIYARMITMANQAGVKVILDASGELLLEGVKAKPYLIKPNKEEFARTFLTEADMGTSDTETSDEKISGTEEIVMRTYEKLLSVGLTYICLSLGAEGAILISKEQMNKSPALQASVRSLQGAGDAMVAGLCKAIYEKREDKMLEYALAMAASTIALEGTQMGNI